jgi:Ca2+-binding RTX toxin-like protein
MGTATMTQSEVSADDERRISELIFARWAGLFPERPDIASTAQLASLAVIKGTAGDDFLWGTEGNDTIAGGKGNDQIYGNQGKDLLQGGQGIDILIGGAGKDSLLGGTGDDSLDGGLGRDEMIGGAGSDVYIVDNKGDNVIEYEDGGQDLIGTFISLTMPLWVEDIIAIEGTPIDLVGNAMANHMAGNSDDNIIRGGKGADSLVGKDGNDTLIGGAGGDTLVGSGDNDILMGNKGSDLLDGGAGDDTLYGGKGEDILIGGMGNNILVGGNGSDRTVIEFPGFQYDVIVNFEIGEAGDRIVIADDVIGVQLTNFIIDEYVRMTSDSGSATISVDSDGGGDSFVIVARIDNVAGLPASSLVVAEDGSLMITSTG